MIIHCTKKLADKLKKHHPISATVLSAPGSDTSLGEWHANFITVARRTMLLFIHNSTRFSFIVPEVKAADYKRLDELFHKGLHNTMRAMGYREELICAAAGRHDPILLDSKTDRSILGSLNQIGQGLEYTVWYDGYEAVIEDFWHHSARLCDRPTSTKGMKQSEALFPAKAMQIYLGFEPEKTVKDVMLEALLARVDQDFERLEQGLLSAEELEQHITNSPNVIPFKRP